MVITRLRGGALSIALATAALPAHAADYGNPHLLKSVGSLAGASAGQSVIVDIRPAADFEKGHIPGARHLDPDAVSDPDSPVAGALRSVTDLGELVRGNGGCNPVEINRHSVSRRFAVSSGSNKRQ